MSITLEVWSHKCIVFYSLSFSVAQWLQCPGSWFKPGSTSRKLSVRKVITKHFWYDQNGLRYCGNTKNIITSKFTKKNKENIKIIVYYWIVYNKLSSRKKYLKIHNFVGCWHNMSSCVQH